MLILVELINYSIYIDCTFMDTVLETIFLDFWGVFLSLSKNVNLMNFIISVIHSRGLEICYFMLCYVTKLEPTIISSLSIILPYIKAI